MPAFINLLDQRRLIAPGGSTIAGQLFFYYTGTSVLAPIWNDVSLTIPSPNPVVVAAGEPIPAIYLDTAIVYRRVIQYADGTYDETDPLGNLFSDEDVGLPVGSVIDFPGAVAPEGFLFCFGQAVSRTTYADLFAAIGTTYGSGNGTTTFNIPDYRGRVLAGKDNMGGATAGRLTGAVSGTVLGATGGESSHTLTEAEMPAHNHTVSTAQFSTPGAIPGGGTLYTVQQATSNTSTTGGSAAHNNIQPTMVTNKIIKAVANSFLSLIDFFPNFDSKANAVAIGISPTATDMGTFTGSTIPDNVTAKTAMQVLENGVEARPITTQHAGQSNFAITMGYGVTGAAAVKIGGSKAFTGTEGILQIGGAGPFDGPFGVGGSGTYLGCVGHPDWPILQPSIRRNAVEFALYGNGTSGLGTSTATTSFTSTSGTFDTADVGRTIWIEGVSRTVVAWISSSQVTLNASVPAGTNLAWHISITSGSGSGTVSGSVFTRVLGDPLIPTFGTGFVFKLNGTAYTVVAVGSNSYTLSSPPAAGTYSYTYETRINDQIAAFRLGPQFPGSDEENLSVLCRTTGYELRPLYAGAGKYRRFAIGNGEYSVGNLATQIDVMTDARLSLGGPAERPTILVEHSSASSVNYINASSAPTGVGPSFRARGADTNIDFYHDTKGTGSHIFTVNSFGSVGFTVYGVTGTDYLAVAADNGAPYIAAAGSSTNVDVRLLPKGTGAVRFGTFTSNADAPVIGYITIKDAAGNLRKVAIIA